MKIKFTTLEYQRAAVAAVTDCFKDQPFEAPFSYNIDPGRTPGRQNVPLYEHLEVEGFRNNPLKISEVELLQNIREVQASQNLVIDQELKADNISRINLDVEMETGTGKTYCYIKTIFELNKLYGWSKFIIMVPSVAIREGIYKSFQMTAEHFQSDYGRAARYFIYNSSALHNIEAFASDSGINVMIINIQAFNARGAANRRIYEELDDFQSRCPIDVLAATRPIIILDEPQKMEGGKTLDSLVSFKPLMLLRYSATHKTPRNLIHRLDAVDAYNQKLVKKIAVRGIEVKGLGGTAGYLYLEDIEISKAAPVACLEMECQLKSGPIKRQIRKVKKGDNLFDLSGGLAQYEGQVLADIDAALGQVEFTGGLVLHCGEAHGNVNEIALRRLQMREAIRAHLDKEERLYDQGIKVLSLFFIDEVAKYRDYSQDDEKGEYARIFEEEYRQERDLRLSRLAFDEGHYHEYLKRDEAAVIHSGYFSIDKNRKMVNPKESGRGEEKGLSTNAADYDLILKDKERLLSLTEPVRFIFSHSALREGWDNPNVFVMGMLKHSGTTVSRRQEVGRGLRLAVNQEGARQDHPAVVHDINVLTVVASEAYGEFVAGLQSEISDSLSARPKKADEGFFQGKVIMAGEEKVSINQPLAKKICRYLDDNGYRDDYNQITPLYRKARADGRLAPLPLDMADLGEGLWRIIDTVYDPSLLPQLEDDRKPTTIPLNDNFSRKEFQALWARINRKAVYKVHFDSDELVKNAARALDKELKVTPLTYIVRKGVQKNTISDESLLAGQGFTVAESVTKSDYTPAHSDISYDLIGKLAGATGLTRRTVASILGRVKPQTFALFKQNPEHFISETGRLINEQKATTIVEKLSYDPITDFYEQSIFTADRLTLSKAEPASARHIRDYVPVDSETERNFVRELNQGVEVIVYAKLPHGFFIPTPVGDYHPDWAIVFDETRVRHIYFVAETKGALSTLELRKIEEIKIECARKFFDKLNEELAAKLDQHQVLYEMVDGYGKLMELVRPRDFTNTSRLEQPVPSERDADLLDVSTLQYYTVEFERSARTTVVFHLITNLIAAKPGLPLKTYFNLAVWATAPKVGEHFLEMTQIDSFQNLLKSNNLSVSGWQGENLNARKVINILTRSGVTIDAVTNLCAPPAKNIKFFSYTFPYISELAEYLEKIDNEYNSCEQTAVEDGLDEQGITDTSLFSKYNPAVIAQARQEMRHIIHLN